jgi:protein tyrosine/serine phosphatase
VHDAAEVKLFPVLIAEEVPLEVKYAQTVVEYADEYRDMMDLVAEPGRLPLLFHCAAGKDRSGILAALLLSLVGVEREIIMEEYMLSSEFCETLYPEAMRGLLDTVETKGGIEAYLQDIGVSSETQAAIKTNLLRDTSPN